MCEYLCVCCVFVCELVTYQHLKTLPNWLQTVPSSIWPLTASSFYPWIRYLSRRLVSRTPWSSTRQPLSMAEYALLHEEVLVHHVQSTLVLDVLHGMHPIAVEPSPSLCVCRLMWNQVDWCEFVWWMWSFYEWITGEKNGGKIVWNIINKRQTLHRQNIDSPTDRSYITQNDRVYMVFIPDCRFLIFYQQGLTEQPKICMYW